MATKLDALLKKREALEQKIAQEQAAAKRKAEIIDMPEFEKILHLDTSILRAGFARILSESGA